MAERRAFYYRDQVAVNASTTLTLLEIVTASGKPCEIIELSIDVENQTNANSVPVPMPSIEIVRSSTAISSPSAQTAYPLDGLLGPATFDTVVNAPGTENIGSLTRYMLKRRVPATGSLWIPYPLGRGLVVDGNVASQRIRCLNQSTGNIALSVSISLTIAE